MAQQRILRGYQAVQDLTGNSRTQIWRNVRDGVFPAPIELGPNSVGWFEEEVLAWLNTRPRRTYCADQVAPQTGSHEQDLNGEHKVTGEPGLSIICIEDIDALETSGK